MGGSNETIVNGLRMHISANHVHIHDDHNNLKFESEATYFKSEVKKALEELKDNDGIIKITGEKSRDDLCIVSDGGILSMFLTCQNSIESDLKTFLKNC
jgi:hypothetical protein